MEKILHNNLEIERPSSKPFNPFFLTGFNEAYGCFYVSVFQHLLNLYMGPYTNFAITALASIKNYLDLLLKYFSCGTACLGSRQAFSISSFKIYKIKSFHIS